MSLREPPSLQLAEYIDSSSGFWGSLWGQADLMDELMGLMLRGGCKHGERNQTRPDEIVVDRDSHLWETPILALLLHGPKP